MDWSEQYKDSKDIYFSARRFNTIRYRFIWIPGVNNNYPIYLTELFPGLEITSQQLAEIFHYELRHTNSYDGLGFCPNRREEFRKLADVLQKNIHVYREDGGTGDHYPLFVACPAVSSNRERGWREFKLECRDYWRRIKYFTPYPSPRKKLLGRSFLVPLWIIRIEQANYYYPRAILDLWHAMRPNILA